MSSSTMRVAGVIGDPVAHSKSPAMHNAAFAYLGIHAQYERWHTPLAELPARIASLRAPHMYGANVTLPHKLAILPLLDEIDPLAELIGAANTIIRLDDGRLRGTNTDAPAFLDEVVHVCGLDPAGLEVVILGASGAARAAAFALAHAGAARITIINRTLERAEELLGDVLSSLAHDPVLTYAAPDEPDLGDVIGAAHIVVNATSLGWHGDETPLPAQFIHPGMVVYDMVYRPTKLLADAQQRGARGYDGIGMLAKQAIIAFEHWTGQRPPLDLMITALRNA
ncbi:MAG: shikimate dehydrogenase [Chloroflexi bacterium]|nr:shikimate dehydrogenase [Chloroflexota bacterium]